MRCFANKVVYPKSHWNFAIKKSVNNE